MLLAPSLPSAHLTLGLNRTHCLEGNSVRCSNIDPATALAQADLAFRYAIGAARARFRESGSSQRLAERRRHLRKLWLRRGGELPVKVELINDGCKVLIPGGIVWHIPKEIAALLLRLLASPVADGAGHTTPAIGFYSRNVELSLSKLLDELKITLSDVNFTLQAAPTEAPSIFAASTASYPSLSGMGLVVTASQGERRAQVWALSKYPYSSTVETLAEAFAPGTRQGSNPSASSRASLVAKMLSQKSLPVCILSYRDNTIDITLPNGRGRLMTTFTAPTLNAAATGSTCLAVAAPGPGSVVPRMRLLEDAARFATVNFRIFDPVDCAWKACALGCPERLREKIGVRQILSAGKEAQQLLGGVEEEQGPPKKVTEANVYSSKSASLMLSLWDDITINVAPLQGQNGTIDCAAPRFCSVKTVFYEEKPDWVVHAAGGHEQRIHHLNKLFRPDDARETLAVAFELAHQEEDVTMWAFSYVMQVWIPIAGKGTETWIRAKIVKELEAELQALGIPFERIAQHGHDRTKKRIVVSAGSQLERALAAAPTPASTADPILAKMLQLPAALPQERAWAIEKGKKTRRFYAGGGSGLLIGVHGSQLYLVQKGVKPIIVHHPARKLRDWRISMWYAKGNNGAGQWVPVAGPGSPGSRLLTSATARKTLETLFKTNLLD